MSVALAATAICARCGCHLRRANDGDLCAPCAATVESCEPFISRPVPQAPPHVDMVRLVAGLMLTHDALHPGEKLYLREALEEYGVEADHVLIQQASLKLRRRYGLVLRGTPREPGYRVESWLARIRSFSVNRVIRPRQLVLWQEDAPASSRLRGRDTGHRRTDVRRV